MRNRRFLSFIISLLFAGCSSSEKENPRGATPAADAPQVDQQVSPAAATGAVAAAGPIEPPPGAKVFFLQPADGDEVVGPLVDGKVEVKVNMGVEGLTVSPAGERKPGTGHHHIVVDDAYVALGAPVPKDDTHLHYGKGQSEALLMLAPGDHKLTLQFADGTHLSYGSQLSATINIKVKPDLEHAKPGEPEEKPKKASN